jgi:hypothetical protein
MPNVTANVIKLPKDKFFKIVVDEYDLKLIDKQDNQTIIVGFRRLKDDLY